MMLDLYHAQIGEGNLIELIRRCGEAIGEIQVADVPGRCEPGHRRDQLPGDRKGVARHRLYRHRRHGGLGFRRLRAALEAFRSAFR